MSTLHNNIRSHGDIRLSADLGDIRLNTKTDRKVYINTSNGSLTMNENAAIAINENFGSVGDVIVSNGEAGTAYSSRLSDLEAEVLILKNYIDELKVFINSFRNAIYLENNSSEEINYDNLL